MNMFKKSNWEKVRLGAVSNKINRKIDPLVKGIKRKIGGENFISSDLKIKSWGIVGEDYLGPAFYMHVVPGDILYVSRNAHLRKVALVDFEAVCANTTYIIRADETKLLQDFLKHVMLSDNFTRFTISSSKGSTNPFINWKDIEKYSFLLPSLSEQTQIADLFQSIESTIEQAEQQEKNLMELKNQLLRELTGGKIQFGNFLFAKDFEKVKFNELVFNISERVEPKETNLTTYVGLEHLDADNLRIERTGTSNDVIGTKLKIYKDDIIFGKRRAYLRKVAVSHFDGIASAHSMILRANENQIEKSFLPHFLQSDIFMQRAVQISEGSLSPTIKWKTLAAQEFILPKKEKQKQLSEIFDQFEKTREEIKTQKLTLKNLKQKLLNEILG